MSCEKCWEDAYMRMMSDPYKSQAEHYMDLVEERKDNPCSPEEQAGKDAAECSHCKRMTVHQITKICTICHKRGA